MTPIPTPDEMDELGRRRRVAQPGVRRARVCTECNRRKFLRPDEPTWDCPEHGARKTIWQTNKPYFGQDTTGEHWPEPIPRPEPEPPPEAGVSNRPTLLWSLKECKDWLRARVEEGETCPCCNQLAQVHPRTIYSTVARDLIAMARAGGMDECRWVEVKHIAPRTSSDLVKCRYWGLMEKQLGEREDGSDRVGLWRMTPKGIAFVRGEVKVPKYARTYDNRCLGFKGREVDIHDCLRRKFDYRELMNA